MTNAGAVEGRLREGLVDLHRELVESGLVVWTAGNVSARIPGEDAFLIKPSGVAYADLTAEAMVRCDLQGRPVGDGLSPSSDTASHAYVYRARTDIGGIVHTHSTYATAWAARGESIPCVLTAMADEFGGDIPCAGFARIGDDGIGRLIVDTLATTGSAAVLLQNHGVFAVGPDARSAVKSAVMCEDAARTVHISRQGGAPIDIDAADIDALHTRYQGEYGQR